MQQQGLYDRGFVIYYKNGDQAIYRKNLIYNSSVSDIYHVILEGETLLDISRRYYKSSYHWYLLSDVNDIIEDIFNLPVGETILIPSLVR